MDMFAQYEKEMAEFQKERGCAVKCNGDLCGREAYLQFNDEWLCLDCWERVRDTIL